MRLLTVPLQPSPPNVGAMPMNPISEARFNELRARQREMQQLTAAQDHRSERELSLRQKEHALAERLRQALADPASTYAAVKGLQNDLIATRNELTGVEITPVDEVTRAHELRQEIASLIDELLGVQRPGQPRNTVNAGTGGVL